MTIRSTIGALSSVTEFAAPLPVRTMHVYRVLDTQTGRIHMVDVPSPEQAEEMVRRAEHYRDNAPSIGWAIGSLATLLLAVLRGILGARRG